MVLLDPYKILGLRTGASPAEIKRAYRRAAKKCHPDLSKSSHATEMFLDVQLAYEYLTKESAEPLQDEGIRGNGWTATRAATAAEYEGGGAGQHHRVRVARDTTRVTSPFYREAEGMESWEGTRRSLSRRRLVRTVWISYLTVLGGAGGLFVLIGASALSAGQSFEGWMAATIGLMLLTLLVMVLDAGRRGTLRRRR